MGLGIGAALAAVGTAIGSAAASIGAAVAAISLTTAFEIATVVGVGLSVVGMVTKNKTLMMVGGVIGAIGGIGSLATSAGLFGAEAASGASLFGAAPAASTASTAETATTSAFGGIASDASNAATYGSTAGAFGGTADVASAGTIPFVADGLPAGQDSFISASMTADKVADPVAALDAGGKTVAETASPITTVDAAPSVTPVTGANPTGTGGVDSVGAETGTWDSAAKVADNRSIFGKVFDYAEKHPTATMGVVQAGSKLLEGMTSTITPAQVDAYNAQAAANNAQASMSNLQRTNLAAPKAVASSSPITGTPQQLIPGAGLLNAAPPRLAQVTGSLV